MLKHFFEHKPLISEEWTTTKYVYIALIHFRYNRQFRYEERTNEGYVKGRYGFFDKYGKLHVVNYSADPIHGFHAEGAGVPEYPH